MKDEVTHSNENYQNFLHQTIFFLIPTQQVINIRHYSGFKIEHSSLLD